MPSVIVVGAGPVGQTAALLLARRGVPVVVLDARTARDPVGSRAIVQQRDVIDIWDAVGVGRRVAAEGVTWRTARTYHRDRELFAVEFVDSGRSPFPPFANVSQARTEELLDERLARTPLAEVRWSHRVTGIAQDAEGVTVTCDTPTGERTLRAPHVLVCAGAKADAIRADLGLTFDGETFDDQFLICDLRTDLPGWETERRFYFDPAWNPGRQVLVHPCPGGTFRVDWQVNPDFDLAGEEASGGLDRRIRQIVGERPYEILWRSVYRFSSRLVPRMRVGRVLLAGDCAHLVSPFGARGLNSGVQDAENAAWKLAHVHNGWSPESLLETYHLERHAAAVENLTVTAATMRFLVPRTEADRAYRRDVLDRAATNPAARTLVDSGRLAEPFWYADSPLTTPNPRYPAAGRPPRGQVNPPAPGVLVPDVPCGDGTRVRAWARRPTCDPVVLDHATVPEVPDGEAWVLRPDAHIAAIVDAGDPDAIAAAVRRATGLPAA
ncbi:FAD-dependent monooxygenase [Virgisporangium aurantiacum]|uniref:Oxygenase n=1 Tax=Virgisporangium aurantiacum TaxID=175570 RepID=A0A8J4DZ65_9ACTN|nr:FAD-dependent monooxygenase [Virgisporangium aurantiacum]GIJ55391.1 oxygenase [Virgisporangium aurantiacum]